MQKRFSTVILITAVFVLAVAGMQYAQPYMTVISPVLYHVVETVMFMCILGAADASIVSGLIVCFASPVTMLVLKDATVISVIILAIANVIVVLLMQLLRKSRLLALALGAVARFALCYGVCFFILSPMLGDMRELGYGMIDKVTIMMLVTTVAGAAVYYFAGLLMGKKLKDEE